MKIVVLYVCVTQGARTQEFAARFVGTYQAFPPGLDHETLVVCNGGPVSTEIGLIFSILNPKFFARGTDAAWDIGAYIAGADGPAADADILVCLGESIYFHREGWLRRVVDAWMKYGAGMYGFYSSNIVRPHMNTTGFATLPSLLREYPLAVQTHKDRYDFEHGERSFWRFVHSRGMPTGAEPARAQRRQDAAPAGEADRDGAAGLADRARPLLHDQGPALRAAPA